MVTKSELIMAIIKAAFSGPVTEQDYHSTVQCLREYSVERDCRELERAAATSRGWPAEYDPCMHMENIRFGMVFGSTTNEEVVRAVQSWNDRH